HDQFAASALSPVPLYRGTCGYAQTGLVNGFAAPPAPRGGAGGCSPRMVAGGLPAASHVSSAASQSTANAPSPPEQWSMLGTRYNATRSLVRFAPSLATTLL